MTWLKKLLCENVLKQKAFQVCLPKVYQISVEPYENLFKKIKQEML